MSELKEPVNVTFRLEGRSEGLQGNIVTDSICVPEFEFGTRADSWALSFRTSDAKAAIFDLTDHRRSVLQSSVLDPTWNGAYAFLSRRMLSSRAECHAAVPEASPVPIATATSLPSHENLRTITSVSVLGPAIYNIEDRGTAVCTNGDLGHALHLWSRTHDPNQQLSDVVVDVKSMRFCTIRFGRNAGFLSSDFSWEIHYADVDGFWLESDGVVEARDHTFGIATKHGLWRFQLRDIRFPETLPPETFSTAVTPSR